MEGKLNKRLSQIEKDNFRRSANEYLSGLKIQRDVWGIPHIFGETDDKCAFGVGYVTCELNFELLQTNLLASRGILAQALGYKHSHNDYYVHLIKIWERIDQHYEKEVSEEAKRICRAYATSVNYYAALNEDKIVHRSLYPVTEKDIIALILHRIPTFVKFERILNTLLSVSDDQLPFFLSNRFDQPIQSSEHAKDLLFSHYNLKNHHHHHHHDNNDERKIEMIGSNAFAVSKNRTFDKKSTYLNINPYLAWEGAQTVFELHVHSDQINNHNNNNDADNNTSILQWNTIGFTFPGFPVLLFGHNRYLGWTHTINHPDILDIYKLDVNSLNSSQYRVDGEWKDFKIEKKQINHKLVGPISWNLEKEIVWSEFGPVVISSNSTYYSIAFSDFSSINSFHLIDQYLRMNKASSFDQWHSALSLSSFPLLNYVYADHQSNIYYHYNAKIPIRSPHYLWNEIVPGNTSETKWNNGFVEFNELPHVKNPSSGFIMNCNTPPFNVTSSSSSSNQCSSQFPYYFDIETQMNNRGMRALELFSRNENIKWEDFKDIKFDVTYSNASLFIQIKNKLIERCIKAVRDRDEWMGNSLMMEALSILQEWDHTVDEYNTEAPLCVLTIYPFIKYDLWDYHRHHDFEDVNLNHVVERFQLVAFQLFRVYHKLKVQWQLINRLHRGDINIGLAGAPDLLFSVFGTPSRKGEYLDAVAGDSHIMLVKWSEDGVSSEAISPFGSSLYNSSSPHFVDQSNLFVDRTLRRVFFERSDIEAHSIEPPLDFSLFLIPDNSSLNDENDDQSKNNDEL